jgi:hypothetical protein
MVADDWGELCTACQAAAFGRQMQIRSKNGWWGTRMAPQPPFPSLSKFDAVHSLFFSPRQAEHGAVRSGISTGWAKEEEEDLEEQEERGWMCSKVEILALVVYEPAVPRILLAAGGYWLGAMDGSDGELILFRRLFLLVVGRCGATVAVSVCSRWTKLAGLQASVWWKPLISATFTMLNSKDE